MKRNPISLLLLAFVATAFATASHAEEAKAEVVGLLFYADWCGSCKVLDPKLEAVKPDFADAPILFTRVDATDAFTKHQSALFASRIGLSKIYEENASSTGFMLLIDADSGKVLDKLVKTQTEAQLRSSIQKALQS